MSTPADKARDFLENEQAFRLGLLPTEQSHPVTAHLSRVIADDLPAGVRQLQAVDRDTLPVAEQVFAGRDYGALVDAFESALKQGRSIIFTGCGATGRLSILLESAWRAFWRDARAQNGPLREQFPGIEDRVRSAMAGGDYALIRSVEGFEDFPVFGRYQLSEAGVSAGDVVVAITEGGETPFVIGTAWQGLDAGASVFFVFNNPADLLCRHVARSREVIEEERIIKLDLSSGPMAIAGSTRMQATTGELLVVGTALETALDRLTGKADELRLQADPATAFRALLDRLESAAAVDALSEWVRLEVDAYAAGGRVTYAADDMVLDVMTDTTERSPTFSLPPFRPCGDDTAPVSWAFLKDPCRSTPDAWRHMLGRDPVGLSWGSDLYRDLGAPASLVAHPPALGPDAILRFRIGNEPDPSRTEAKPAVLIRLHSQGRGAPGDLSDQGAYDEVADMAIPFDRPVEAGPLRLWEHLVVKLVMNTVSTATMARLGYVTGNWMVHVSASNKKLIDRSVRLIASQAGMSYEHACHELFLTLESPSAGAPVAETLDRLLSRG
ncbi:MAG: sugar phosphate isomerase [Kiritimatiellia bacterium]|jgi:N-acetylmuramic acid 6-phosphate etherase|nr:sugar phosphate isomerase [Kiritimatiellia bacterium]MDP6629594.1 sugar phosphate isomerase [Kiritimatiellia bacterium]MDP6809301.1 sugar phosphate isomerase [Kiritimatiellia bacterium]MDP7023039.1 sugar phosphate isomerase [Kiritimatiellia bacterium]